MSTIVTRAGKGSPLTFNEVDANFTNLNTDKIQSGNTVPALTITSATINGGTITGITDLAIADGGTGASTAENARTNLGVTSTSDLASSTGSSLVGHIASGTGAVARIAQSKLRDIVNVSDFETATQAKDAVTALGTGTVEVPNMGTATIPASYPAVVFDYKSEVNHNVFSEVETFGRSKRLLKAQHGTHSGTQQINVSGIEFRPIGSGLNGPNNADVGQVISVIKQNYLTTSVDGEIDGLYIIVRQGGSKTTTQDCAGILVDVATVTGVGFSAAFEAATREVNSSGVVQKQVQTQVGVMDTFTNTFIGFAAIATTGEISDGIRLLNSGTSTFTNFMRCKNASDVDLFSIDGLGRIVLKAASGATPSKTIRVSSGNLNILNDAQDANIFTLSDTGGISCVGINAGAGSFTGANLVVNSNATAGAAGTVTFGTQTSTTIGVAGGAAALPATPLGYLVVYIAGTAVKLPYYNA